MNFFHKTLFIVAISCFSFSVRAQDNSSVPDLIKQGVQLNDQGNYHAGAIEKYDEARKIDPDNAPGMLLRKWRFSLFASEKANEAVSTR